MSVTENSPSKITDEKREKRKRVYPVPVCFWVVLHIKFRQRSSYKLIGSFFFFFSQERTLLWTLLSEYLKSSFIHNSSLRLQNIFWSVSVHLRPLQAILLIEVVQKAICLYKTSVYKMSLKGLLQNRRSSGNLLPVKKKGFPKIIHPQNDLRQSPVCKIHFVCRRPVAFASDFWLKGSSNCLPCPQLKSIQKIFCLQKTHK